MVMDDRVKKLKDKLVRIAGLVEAFETRPDESLPGMYCFKVETAKWLLDELKHCLIREREREPKIAKYERIIAELRRDNVTHEQEITHLRERLESDGAKAWRKRAMEASCGYNGDCEAAKTLRVVHSMANTIVNLTEDC